MRAAVDIKIALARFNDFLRAEKRITTVRRDDRAEHAVAVRDAMFRWTSLDDTPKFELSVPDLRIARGALVAVVGQIGTGKSALCMALLDRMAVKSGTVTLGASAPAD